MRLTYGWGLPNHGGTRHSFRIDFGWTVAPLAVKSRQTLVAAVRWNFKLYYIGVIWDKL